jgi:DNA (cytosine-5)-methyltransferase 1
MSFTSIDLFSGVGGLSLGLEWANFECLLATDFDREIGETFQKNFKETTFISDDIENLNFRQIRKDIGIKKGDLDLVVGGPPCQGFSMANRKRIEQDPRNLLFRHFCKAVDELQPKCFLIENVTGLSSEKITLRTKDHSVVDIIGKYFKNIGYQIRFISFKSEEFGIPQYRRRVLIIGTRLKKQQSKLLHEEIGELRGEYSSYETMKVANADQITLFNQKAMTPFTVWDSIADLPTIKAGVDGSGLKYRARPTNEYQRLMRKSSRGVYNHVSTPHDDMALKRIRLIKQGQNFNNLPEELKTKSVHSGAWGRLEANGLAPTITTRFDTPSTGRVIHPYSNRTITVREAARIQSFPDNFIFYGTRTSQGKQVGNAVPPLVAKAIGEMFIEQFLT